jgi:hypothetical protein
MRSMGLAGTVVESDDAAEGCGFSADGDGGDEDLGYNLFDPYMTCI